MDSREQNIQKQWTSQNATTYNHADSFGIFSRIAGQIEKLLQMVNSPFLRYKITSGTKINDGMGTVPFHKCVSSSHL
jgi:hypothetical protein